MDAYTWYGELLKPSWAPPAWLFGPVWTVLYVIIAISFGSVFLRVFRKRMPAAVAVPFVVNLVANFAYTPLQFQLRSNLLASIDILIVLSTIIWAMIAVWPHDRRVTYAQIPYLAWVSFATVLQLTITVMNA